jgi:hypothetical protein
VQLCHRIYWQLRVISAAATVDHPWERTLHWDLELHIPCCHCLKDIVTAHCDRALCPERAMDVVERNERDNESESGCWAAQFVTDNCCCYVEPESSILQLQMLVAPSSVCCCYVEPECSILQLQMLVAPGSMCCCYVEPECSILQLQMLVAPDSVHCCYVEPHMS